ncbi:MAG: permease prefix domain 2-containing transporter [Bacteroidia bacterium]
MESVSRAFFGLEIWFLIQNSYEFFQTSPLPRRAEKLLEWFIRDELAEEVLGDLEEKFYAAVLEEKVSSEPK